MSDTWFTIEQAAVRLGLSVRTINRHINAGKLQSRLFEGRREVLIGDSYPTADAISASRQANAAEETVQEPVSKPKSPATLRQADSDNPTATQSRDALPFDPPPASSASSNAGIDAETMLALADNWADRADLAANSYQTLALTYERRAVELTRSNRIAWSAVSVIIACILVAVGWTTYQLTRTTVENQVLKTKVEDANTAATSARNELEETVRRTKAELADAVQRAKEENQHNSETADAQVRALSLQLLNATQELAHLRGQVEGAIQAQSRMAGTPTSNPIVSSPTSVPAPTTNSVTANPVNLVTRPALTPTPRGVPPANGRGG